jgi:capsular polysaccharide biosynthesis protein
VSDSEETMTLHLGRSAELAGGGAPDAPDNLWSDDFPSDADRPAAEPAAGLVTLGYLRAAVRRSRRFILALAIVGLVIGVGLLKAAPLAQSATTTLFLAHNTDEDAVEAQLTDQVLAQSDAVALRTMRNLGLHETLKSFESSYTVTVVTNSIMTIVFRAPRISTAIHDENALTAEFLRFRTAQLENDQAGMLASLNQQVTQAASQVAAQARQITSLQAQPSTAATKAKLAVLQARHTQAAAALVILTQTVQGNQASTQVMTAQIVKGSTVLNSATPVPPSHVKVLAEYVGGGLIGGAALGLVIVLIRTLISDRLRRRDDVARVLGAPVRLSIVGGRPRRWWRGGRGLAAASGRDFQRVIAFLASEVAARPSGGAGLAVVPAGDPRIAAVCLTALAVSLAKDGKRVVLADLSGELAAARLLGVKTPGVSKISADGASLVVVVPGPDNLVPVGPLRGSVTPAISNADAEPYAAELAAAHKSADLLLTLAALDPAVGAEHLTTWTAKVIAVVAAGQSSATRIQALGEMVRVAGLSLPAAVLVGADKTDESLGVSPSPDDAPHAEAGSPR